MELKILRSMRRLASSDPTVPNMDGSEKPKEQLESNGPVETSEPAGPVTEPKASHGDLYLSSELMDKICSSVIADHGPIELNIYDGWSPLSFIESLKPTVVKWNGRPCTLSSLMDGHPSLLERVLDCLNRECWFYTKPDYFQSSSFTFGKARLATVQKLQLNIGIVMQMSHDDMWGELLRMLSEHMPNLSTLQLITSWDLGESPYSEYDHDMVRFSEDRESQAIRSVLRFAAFLNLRHPRLNRLILPAINDPRLEYREWGGNFCVFLDRGMKEKPGDISENLESMWAYVDGEESEDMYGNIQLEGPEKSNAAGMYEMEAQVLNATQIRRYKNVDLTDTSLKTFFIEPPEGLTKAHISNSEIPEPTDHYKIVDKMGYLDQETLTEKGWRYFTVDHLLDFCERVQTANPTKDDLVQLVLAAENQKAVVDRERTAERFEREAEDRDSLAKSVQIVSLTESLQEAQAELRRVRREAEKNQADIQAEWVAEFVANRELELN